MTLLRRLFPPIAYMGESNILRNQFAMRGVMSIHPELRQGSRLAAWLRTQPRVSLFDIAVLAVLGCCAALFSAFVDLPNVLRSLTGMSMQLPGNTIIRSFLPLALGVALVPRRFAATAISACALILARVLNLTGKAAIGTAAVASLGITGPLLDITTWSAQNAWRLYGGFVLTGLISNMFAYAVRGAAKYHHERHGSFSSILLADWWSKAAASYTLCGLAVGLLCALIWFRLPRVNRDVSDARA